MKFNENIINDFKNANDKLRKKYIDVKKSNKEDIRKFLNIKTMKKLSTEELQGIANQGYIVGVDGSKNKIGNLYPHYMMAIQALAKPMDNIKLSIFESEVYTPITDNLDIKEAEEKEKNIMAELEVSVAIRSIHEHHPKMIMMDGSLMSHRISCPDRWEELKTLCINKNIILIGVIEEVKTQEMSGYLSDKGINISHDFYDKEIMFGILEESEYIIVDNKKSNKDDENIGSCLSRTSKDPSVIGIDFLNTQISELDMICDIVYTLTPSDSRGIPIWLDIVDEEVKISNNIMKILVETYIDEDLSKMFLIPKRQNRNL